MGIVCRSIAHRYNIAGIDKQAEYNTSMAFFVGNSKITGGHNGVAGVDKVINCYDANYDPIPNL